MIRPEYLRPPWLYFEGLDSSNIDKSRDYELATNDLPSNLSFPIPYATDMSSTEQMPFQAHVNGFENFSLELEKLGSILNTEMNHVHLSDSLEAVDENSFPFPTEDMEVDNQLSMLHLVMAFGEAMEKGEMTLANVIVNRLNEKLSPVGGPLDRVFYYLFQPYDKQLDYLKQESFKNFNAAFMAFYQIFPYGRFAHFVADSAILEAMPHDARIIHIFDFDICNGVQWTPIIEAISLQPRELKLTLIKQSSSLWKFEDAKRYLYDHARAFGVKLTVDEMALTDLSQAKELMRRGDKKEWFVFNCMTGLPHMGRMTCRKEVKSFLRIASEILRENDGSTSHFTHSSPLLSQSAWSAEDSMGFPLSTSLSCGGIGHDRGLITFGDGDAWEKAKGSFNFSSFLNGYLLHYQNLFESMDCNFPIHLREAKTAMECLFVAPFVSYTEWSKIWQNECCDLESGFALEGWKVSEESVMEAKELVREGENLYEVRIEGENGNEMVLEWQNTPLLRVCCWRN